MEDQGLSESQLRQKLEQMSQRMAALEAAEAERNEDLRKAREELAGEELAMRVRQRTTELVATNEELKQERNLLHTLMDYLPHNIYFKDRASRFLRINKAMARFFGLQHPSQALGKTDLDFFTGEHASQALADEQEIVRTGHPILDKEERETWPDGRMTWASTTKMPLFDDSGQIVGTFGMSRDITGEKQAAEALRAAKEAAEAANRAKSTFLANMSHEIRTPLNAIIGMTELVLKSQVSSQQREFLATVRDSGEALLSVINDILDFSKIEAGKFVLDRQVFDLRESLGDTMKSFAIRPISRAWSWLAISTPTCPGWWSAIIIVSARSSSTWWATRSSLRNRARWSWRSAWNRSLGRMSSCTLSSATPASASRKTNERRSSRCSSKPTAPRLAAMAEQGWDSRLRRD